jgi:hypothetical protein
MQVEAIRSALAQVAPDLLPRFDEAWVAATAKTRLSVSATPLRNFVQGWDQRRVRSLSSGLRGINYRPPVGG